MRDRTQRHLSQPTRSQYTGRTTHGDGDDDFAAYAQARQHHLYRTAYLLCGDHDRAQDLVQTTLTNLLRSWKRARGADNPDAYAKKALVRAFLTEQRKHRREVAAHRLAAEPDAFAAPSRTELRMVVVEALRALPPKPRAMVILRYWEDQSVAETAALLGCSEGNVKSQCSHALAKLLHTWCQGKVAYADLPGHLGYLRVSDFTGLTPTDTFATNSAAFNATLDDIFTSARTSGPDRLQGLIVDVRVNGGGDDPLGLDLASRLTGEPFLAYAKRVRNDPVDPDRFTKPQPIFVRPATAPRYAGPIAILTAGSTFSAGETFTQAMLDRTPRPVLIGENTQGVFSDILDRQLPNG